MLLAVLGDVAGVQALGQDEVDLERAALPVAPDRIAQDELELGPIERALARVQLGLDPGRLDRVPKRPLGPVPDRVLAGPDRRPVGEVDPQVGEPEVAIDGLQERAEALRIRP